MADRFDKFTERARRVLSLAQEEAQHWKEQELALAKERLQSGTASLFDVMRASREDAEATDQAVEAAALYRTAQIRLAHAMGQMEKFYESTKGST